MNRELLILAPHRHRCASRRHHGHHGARPHARLLSRRGHDLLAGGSRPHDAAALLHPVDHARVRARVPLHGGRRCLSPIAAPGHDHGAALALSLDARPLAGDRRAHGDAAGDELLRRCPLPRAPPGVVGARLVDDRAGGARSPAPPRAGDRQHRRHRPAQRVRRRAGGAVRRLLRALERPSPARRLLPRWASPSSPAIRWCRGWR